MDHIEKTKSKRLAVAPMMEWTDRHCRSFHRTLTKDATLYTEMVTTGALIHGDVPRHLDYSHDQHPVVLQLGGSDPSELAQAAVLAQQWGYNEVDLNCGCPSERVQRGAFGACLMAEPALVADCVRAMKSAVDIPISVKHRLGLDSMDAENSEVDYQFALNFILAVADAGASQVTIHARNAVLKGLSPKENRTKPPLRYEVAAQLRLDAQKQFPHIQVLLNGGLETNEQIAGHWDHFDGFMVGRAAYHFPAMLLGWDDLLASNGEAAGYLFSETEWHRIQVGLVGQVQAWFDECRAKEKPFYIGAFTRHILGLAHGRAGSRYWRQRLSDHHALAKVQSRAAIGDFFLDASLTLGDWAAFELGPT
ncbi:tRNA-U16,U17-dihydrouridine synthase [Polynucleobacter brandtiae]|uniref:tRNA-U16,U17-dihydrouridine synthase n=1 Tax=Polynucleobacter brandtiae TaxID=1938816 RepID=A0A2M8VIP5_9BURK|nr:tRNA-U16,U17-dihydrouridine synthase [Polynucleobacter brandtiae]